MTASVHLPPFAERLRLSQVKLKWCHWRTSNFFDEFGLRKIKIICTFVIMPPSSEFWIKSVDMYARWIDRGMRIVNSCKIIMYVNENWSSFFRSPNSSNFFRSSSTSSFKLGLQTAVIKKKSSVRMSRFCRSGYNCLFLGVLPTWTCLTYNIQVTYFRLNTWMGMSRKYTNPVFATRSTTTVQYFNVPDGMPRSGRAVGLYFSMRSLRSDVGVLSLHRLKRSMVCTVWSVAHANWRWASSRLI